MTDAERVTAALVEWRACLGEEHATAEGEALAQAETATFATTQRVSAILRPQSAAEVAECVRIARRHSVALYPVSGGRNWGYGSRVPVESGCAIVDLGRLTRITAYDAELATVTLEPGVTQLQLSRFLDERGGLHWMDPTASSAHASVVANALERGHGFTPYADHGATVCDLEVVLGTGEIIHTGYRAHGADTPLATLDRYGVGPQLDGLFLQSNLGIVTRATIWLLPAPAHVELTVLRLRDEAQLAAVIDALRPLRLAGVIRSGPRFSNVYRGLQYQGYPWQEHDGKTPLPRERAIELGSRVGVAPWSGIVGLYGSHAEVAAQRDQVRAALDGKADPAFYGEKEIAELPPGAGATQLRGQLAIFRGRILGEGAAAALPYWRKRGVVARPIDRAAPEEHRCGTVWTTASTPLRGADARTVVELVSAMLLDGGFEPDISCVALRDRTLSYHISVTYDRDVDGDDERALACSASLRAALRERGYHPYRLGVQSMDSMGFADAAYLEVLRALKKALDPDDVIAPGRYIPA